MRRLALAASAAFSLSVPRVARAQPPAPNGPEIPANFFSTVFHEWSLAPAPGECAIPSRPCFSGFAAWGQRAGTNNAFGYQILVGLQSTSLPDRLRLNSSYGQYIVNGALDYSFEAGSIARSDGVNAAGPWFVASSGGLPEFTRSGASPYAFDLKRVSVEYDYFDAGGPAMGNMLLKATVTPEPATFALTLGGLAAIGVIARRRRRA